MLYRTFVYQPTTYWEWSFSKLKNKFTSEISEHRKDFSFSIVTQQITDWAPPSGNLTVWIVQKGNSYWWNDEKRKNNDWSDWWEFLSIIDLAVAFLYWQFFSPNMMVVRAQWVSILKYWCSACEALETINKTTNASIQMWSRRLV